MKPLSKLAVGMCALFLAAFACCRSAPKSPKAKAVDSLKSATDSLLASINKVDSATEETMTAPKFDPAKVYGFGIFKIGAGEDSVIHELEKGHRKLGVISTRSEDIDFGVKHVFNEDKYILRVNHPRSTLNDYDELTHASWSDEVSVYKVPKYTVDSLELNNLFAIFYHHRLVEVACDWSVELHNALESKYGKPDHEDRDIAQHPPYYSVSWNNGDIETTYSTVFEYAQVRIKGGFRFLSGLSDRAFKVQNEKDKQANKQKLKSF